MNDKSVAIRPARREDVPAIVAMLADDHLGRARERVEDHVRVASDCRSRGIGEQIGAMGNR